MKISLVLLTFNRVEMVKECVLKNIKNAGCKIYEIICVDNGSTDGVVVYLMGELYERYSGDIKLKFVQFENNMGVARGYNTGYALSEGDIIARPGTDMLMPKNWLKDMVETLEDIENSGIVAVWHVEPEDVIERIRAGAYTTKRQHEVFPAKSLGSQVFWSKVLRQGYILESGLLYDSADVRWEETVHEKYENVVLVDWKPFHIGDSDPERYPEYRKFKDEQVEKEKELAKREAEE